MDLFLTLAGETGTVANEIVAIGTGNGFCMQTANIWQIIGYVLLVFKIAIPVLLIIFGIIDLGKAVIASKDDEIKKSISALIKRAIASVIIFLLPTIIAFIMGIISDFKKNENDFEICRKCVTNPNGEGECKTWGANAWK